MTINLEGKKKPKTAASLVPAPALDQLNLQLAAQADRLEIQTRAAVQRWRDDTKARLQGAVAEELAIVAEDEDFFGFSGMFDDLPDEAPAIDIGAAIV